MDFLTEYVRSQEATVPLQGFVINLVLTAVCSMLLGWGYVNFGATCSNRRAFARNFTLLAVTTMIVVSVVGSSLALSLGLVGALSIIRFRGAIKEPEELSFLFISISIGLGFGANQGLITVLGLAGLGVIVFTSFRWRVAHENERPLNLLVSSTDPEAAGLKAIVGVLEAGCEAVSLRRFDSGSGRVEGAFQIEATGFEQIESVRAQLQALSDTVSVTFVDNEGIF